jgi:hypothetical protein
LQELVQKLTTPWNKHHKIFKAQMWAMWKDSDVDPHYLHSAGVKAARNTE